MSSTKQWYEPPESLRLQYFESGILYNQRRVTRVKDRVVCVDCVDDEDTDGDVDE